MRRRYPKPTRPIRTEQGVEARSRRGAFVDSWWAERWIGSLEALMDPGRLGRGKRYARQGQVLSLHEEPGGVTCEVQGSRRTPYRVSIRLQALGDDAWERVFDAMAERASFAASLLAGEMPGEVDEAFAAAGTALFPAEEHELGLTCSCPDWASVCKHVAACCYLLGERFDDDPFLLFRLRGRDQHAVVAALQARRGGGAGGGPADATAHADSNVGEASGEEGAGQEAPLRLEGFWSAPREVPAIGLGRERDNLSVLRRLGPFSLLRNDPASRLGPAYEAVAREAMEAFLALRDADPDDDADDPDDDEGEDHDEDRGPPEESGGR
ncbi:MAG: hypothetical protein U5K81_10330 [Trueperaceae bacterium]|nr:hypothetical protein [Trueperaceae bacterium]